MKFEGFIVQALIVTKHVPKWQLSYLHKHSVLTYWLCHGHIGGSTTA